MDILETKLTRLDKLLASYGQLAVAFSCGDDSLFLLARAKKVLGGNVFALLAEAEIFSPHAKDGWRQAAGELGADMFGVPTREMHELDFIENTPERCRFCRRFLLGAILKAARNFYVEHAAVGLNADVAAQGLYACGTVTDLGVLAPLAEVGLTAAEIAEAVRRMGLDLPATRPGCLAENVSHDVALDSETLGFVAETETFLRELGIPARVLVQDDGKAQVKAAPMDVETMQQVVDFVRVRGFEIIWSD